jgi:hypothetical protein
MIMSYGERGRLTYIGSRIQCHVCGKAFHSLASHVWRAHDISAKEYRRIFGLHRRLGLVTDALHRRLSAVRGAAIDKRTINDSVDAYELTCVVCGAPMLVRIPESRRADRPKVCGKAECLSAHTRNVHTGATRSDKARRAIQAAAKKRGRGAHLETPEARAKAATAIRGRALSEAAKEKMRGPRVARVPWACCVCGAVRLVPPNLLRVRSCGSTECVLVLRRAVYALGLGRPVGAPICADAKA